MLRIEDIDTPRLRSGADRQIIDTLEIFGLEWDGDIVYQSGRLDRYEQALVQLADRGILYRCRCPRKMTRGKPYPGTCRPHTCKDGNYPDFGRMWNDAHGTYGLRAGEDEKPYSLRIITPDYPVTFDDAIQGRQTGRPAELTGDFILRRSDGLIAYNLAVVIDDAAQHITHVVRGADLLDTSFNQVYRQAPEPDLARADKRDILAWAVDHWKIEEMHSSPTGQARLLV